MKTMFKNSNKLWKQMDIIKTTFVKKTMLIEQLIL